MWNYWPDFDSQLQSLDALRRRMDRVFEEASQDTNQDTWQPRAVAVETDAGYLLTLDVPGYAEKDIQVSIHTDQLTVTGARHDAYADTWTAHRLERGNVNFSRTFTWPTLIDAEGATAAVQNGVLNITLPKAAAARPRQITVATH